MAAQTPPFALQNSALHSAALFRQAAFSPWLGGGVMAPGEYAVTAQGTPNMSVVVAAGRAWITGTQVANVSGQAFSTQAAYFGLNDAPVTVTIAAANATNPRIDLIYAAVQDAFYSGSNNQLVIGVVTGTPAGSPAAPAAPSNALTLATVAVAANATSITNGNISQTAVASLLTVARGGIDPVLSTDVTAPAYDGQYRDHPTYGLQRGKSSAFTGDIAVPMSGFYTGSATSVPSATTVNMPNLTATRQGGGLALTFSAGQFTLPAGQWLLSWDISLSGALQTGRAFMDIETGGGRRPWGNTGEDSSGGSWLINLAVATTLTATYFITASASMTATHSLRVARLGPVA